MSIDVKRAYFYAAARRDVYIEIPPEDREAGGEDMIAKLNLSLYGTRDAAQTWTEEYTKTLKDLGFKTGKATPCNFKHSSKELSVTVHGADFTIVGPEDSLVWLNKELAHRYEIKSSYLGPDAWMEQEIRVLNRTIRWTPEGIEYEPDQRHAEIVIDQLNLTSAKPVATPGANDQDDDDRDKFPLLPPAEATHYRALAACVNYLAMDRVDIQFVAKEISKYMSQPRTTDHNKMKRLGRYLLGKPRYIQHYLWQQPTSEISVFTDSDWAGDKITRKSTSGGMMLIGQHLIKSWSSTQPVIALSSAEAELYALVKGATQAVGLASMLQDLDVDTHQNIY